MRPTPDLDALDILVPNFKRRLSGVTSTILRLVPLQAQSMAVAAVAPELPSEVPQVRPRAMLTMSRRGPHGARVWHARRNIEMLAGLLLRDVLRKDLKLLFTSAAQRSHTGYTRSLVSRMDAVIATTAKAGSFLDRPADVIMHGIDTEVFCPPEDRAALKAALGFGAGPLIGCFGRIRHQKGTDVLVEALCDVLPKHADAQAVILGRVLPKERPFMDALHDRLKAAGLQDRVHFPGEVPWDALLAHFKALDLYVAPQRWEGFGLTPLEAMACGVPCVATTVGAFPELITDQVGTLIPPEDRPAMSAAISEYLGDADMRRTKGAAARSHADANFRIEGEAEAIMAIYRKLLAEA